jgi:hypothetical protein
LTDFRNLVAYFIGFIKLIFSDTKSLELMVHFFFSK